MIVLCSVCCNQRGERETERDFNALASQQVWARARLASGLTAPNVPKHMLAGKQMALDRSTPVLQGQSMPCCSNGIMTETEKMETLLTTHPYKATSSFDGSAQRARCTAGRPRHAVETQATNRQDALVVMGTSCVSAISLQIVCPDIAADFDVENNGVAAAEVISSPGTKYSWLSDEPGAKKRSVNLRTQHIRKKFITAARHLHL